jgi:hypothetical protein
MRVCVFLGGPSRLVYCLERPDPESGDVPRVPSVGA